MACARSSTNVYTTMADFERELICGRTVTGLHSVRARGRNCAESEPQSIGRPMPLSIHRLVDLSMDAPAPLNPWSGPKGRNPPKL